MLQKTDLWLYGSTSDALEVAKDIFQEALQLGIADDGLAWALHALLSEFVTISPEFWTEMVEGKIMAYCSAVETPEAELN